MVEGFTIKLLPIVYSDLRDAKNWYNNHGGGLGDKFQQAVNKEIDYIGQNPEHFQRRYKELRLTSVTGFPYAVFYIVEAEKKLVVIFGVLHTRRNPEYIQKRIP